MDRMKRAVAVVGMASSLALVPAVAASAQPVVTGGLVNVTVTNVLNNNTVNVAIPINAAANICNVSVTAIATLVNTPGGTCTSTSGNQILTFP